jgi:hypothetical protein
MNLNAKLHTLGKIYGVYDRFTAAMTVSCGPRCSTCCTPDVAMTTLEGIFVLNRATSEVKNRLLKKLEAIPHANRFCPEITLNHLARRYTQGKEIPEEKDHLPEGRCPLLEDDLCLIYPARPFGCRCLVSTRNCRITGFAEMDPFRLTVNTLFLQFIEHIDAGGLFGNLSDILLFFQSEKIVKAYENNTGLEPKASLIQNEPISALLIPPEHKHRAEDILCELQDII